MDKCSISNEGIPSNDSSALLQYLQGDWSAHRSPNGPDLEKVLSLKIKEDGIIRIKYYAASTPNEDELLFSIDPDDNIKIESFKERIRVRKFGKNKFKFYTPDDQVLSEFEHVLFVYTFTRVG